MTQSLRSEGISASRTTHLRASVPSGIRPVFPDSSLKILLPVRNPPSFHGQLPSIPFSRPESAQFSRTAPSKTLVPSGIRSVFPDSSHQNPRLVRILPSFPGQLPSKPSSCPDSAQFSRIAPSKTLLPSGIRPVFPDSSLKILLPIRNLSSFPGHPPQNPSPIRNPPSFPGHPPQVIRYPSVYQRFAQSTCSPLAAGTSCK